MIHAVIYYGKEYGVILKEKQRRLIVEYNRLEPYNDEAETNLITSIISNPDQAHRAMATLEESDFYHLHNKKIYRAIKDIAENGKEPDYLNVSDWIKTRQYEVNGEL